MSEAEKEVIIKINLELNGDTAIKIMNCLKENEPKIWQELRSELKQIKTNK
jgi:hypothetical protein